ncbi:MAG: hypothetical protein KDC46_13095 [Thermoleophilia bacterium]|nr:hypothetical protein [Thermoleophilia bacterium]
MTMFLIALVVGSVGAVIGVALAAVVTSSLWLAIVGAIVGFIAGVGLWETLVNRRGGIHDTEYVHYHGHGKSDRRYEA